MGGQSAGLAAAGGVSLPLTSAAPAGPAALPSPLRGGVGGGGRHA